MSGSGSGLLDLVLEGLELLLQKESGSGKFWRQSGAFFEWGGSEFYELSYWIRL